MAMEAGLTATVTATGADAGGRGGRPWDPARRPVVPAGLPGADGLLGQQPEWSESL